MLFKKILVAVDGSKHSDKAAQYARGVARTQNAELVLLHCPGNIPRLIGGAAREKLQQDLEEAGRQLVANYQNLCEGFNVCYTIEVKIGDPANVLIKYAEENGVDLIVMGSRGLTDLEGLLLGSVTHHVLQRTCCPVLIIR